MLAILCVLSPSIGNPQDLPRRCAVVRRFWPGSAGVSPAFSSSSTRTASPCWRCRSPSKAGGTARAPNPQTIRVGSDISVTLLFCETFRVCSYFDLLGARFCAQRDALRSSIELRMPGAGDPGNYMHAVRARMPALPVRRAGFRYPDGTGSGGLLSVGAIGGKGSLGAARRSAQGQRTTSRSGAASACRYCPSPVRSLAPEEVGVK